MKRVVIIVGTLTLMVALQVAVSRAGDQAQQPQAAQQAAPAANADKAVGTASGCMPDGSCCGNAACAQAAKASDKGATGEAAGGCPCMKNKKAQ